METIKKYIARAKAYAVSPGGKDMLIGVGVVVGIIALIGGIVFFIQNSGTKIVYQPTIACDLFTEDEAKEMLGQQVLHQPPANPTIQSNVVTSKCGYTDANPEQDQMVVAAVAVRSGVNDEGVEKNASEFAVAKQAQGAQVVNTMGDSAFFNPEVGQLNVLKGRDWIIVSYGVGASPKTNALDTALELAQKVISDPHLPTF